MTKKKKNKGGRPPLSRVGKMDTRVIVSIHKQTLEQIEENTAGSVSAFIRDAIAEKLQAYDAAGSDRFKSSSQKITTGK